MARPSSRDAARLIRQFAEKEGIALMDDALDRLQEYRAIARSDFDLPRSTRRLVPMPGRSSWMPWTRCGWKLPKGQ